MCGIFGYQFKQGETMPREGVRMLLAAKLAEGNDRRGGHSWGFASLDEGLAASNALLIDRDTGEMFPDSHKMVGATTLMAHTRWATHGGKTIENAHPFEIGDLVGAHNGIIYNHHSLCLKYERKFEVDSMHLFQHLVEGRPFDDLEGYGSIEWIDKSDLSRVNLCRMKRGELAIAAIVEKKGDKDPIGVAWSSDDKHLTDALKLAGLRYFEYKVDHEKIYFVQDGKLWVTERELNLSSTTIITGTKGYDWRNYLDGEWTSKYGSYSRDSRITRPKILGPVETNPLGTTTPSTTPTTTSVLMPDDYADDAKGNITPVPPVSDMVLGSGRDIDAGGWPEKSSGDGVREMNLTTSKGKTFTETFIEDDESLEDACERAMQAMPDGMDVAECPNCHEEVLLADVRCDVCGTLLDEEVMIEQWRENKALELLENFEMTDANRRLTGRK